MFLIWSNAVADLGIFERLSVPDAVGRTESDIQSDIKLLLLSGDFQLETPRLEEQIGDGSQRRIDVAIGATVIEVKKSLNTTSHLSTYEAQLGGYVSTRIEQNGSRYNGILTDGKSWFLYETDPSDDEFKRHASFTLESKEQGRGLVEWLRAVLSIHDQISPTPNTIEAYLGSSSPTYAQDRAYLSGLYSSVADTDPTVGLKRELWARLLRSALGTGFKDADDLFIDHTLLVIEATAIGHAVMDISLAEVASDPRALLNGSAFEDAGIHNAVEAGFFDWVLATDGGEHFVQQVVRRISMFNWNTTEHDVLKVLYESVINAETRKGLGEYYTPDWLAEGVIEKSVTSPLTQKVLDPSCGSGTFVYHVVRKMIRECMSAGWDNRQILNHVQNHVFGLDIHPVSVALARITYLLALGDNLQDDRDDLWIPVHLGDSIQWHQNAEGDDDSIKINTEGVDLTVTQNAHATLFDFGKILAFPLSNIDDPGTFDRLVTAMTDRAKTHTDASKKRPTVDGILNSFGIQRGADFDTLSETFHLLCDLNAEGRDSIWGYFVRNQVRPLWLSMKSRRVDVLVGNPPWVSYRFMTDDMQTQFKAFSEARNLWHGLKMAPTQDLVGLFAVRAVEKYLNDGGTFGFVVPLSVLSRQQYDGFRQGNWGPTLRGEITEMWDLDAVRPTGDLFPVPAGVIYGQRHTATIGLTDTTVPHGVPSDKVVLSGLRDRSGWTKTKPQLQFVVVPNRAIGANALGQSPYRSTVAQGATIVPRALHFVNEESSTNKLGQTAGKASVSSFRTTLEKAPWKNLPGLTGVVEKRFIHPVHLGSTVVPFRTLAPWKAVLPIERGELLPEEKIADAPQGISRWWAEASVVWETNKSKTNKLSLWDRINFQRLMHKQLGGSKYRVVYSASGNTLVSAILDNPQEIIEHALYWLPARSLDEARYLNVILNAPVTTREVSEYQSKGLFGNRHFDTYVWMLPIPSFDHSSPLHQEISSLGADCEVLADGVDLDGMKFQSARKKVRTALSDAGLTDEIDRLVSDLLNS
ncbi:N-6 DNA methylase [Glutamicibacter ardleyensis]|uniref:N-6 DNA methylase n=1 Tax=Glutamicibacter ardleyensis TaxID=225894 RepID=UPI003FD6AA6A